MKVDLSEVTVTTEQRFALDEAVAVALPEPAADQVGLTTTYGFLVHDFVVVTEIMIGGATRTRYRFYGKRLRRDGRPRAEMRRHVDVDGSADGSYLLLKPFLEAVRLYSEGG